MFPKLETALFQTEIRVTLIEFGDLSASIDQPVLSGPGWMGLRIDVEAQRVAWLSPSGAGDKGRAIRHLDGDLMVIGVNFFFHHSAFKARRAL